jgi:hypothetical protein
MTPATFFGFHTCLIIGYVLGPVLIMLHLRRFTRRTAMLTSGKSGRSGARVIALGFTTLFVTLVALYADALFQLNWYLWIDRFDWLIAAVIADMGLIAVGLALLAHHLLRTAITTCHQTPHISGDLI